MRSCEKFAATTSTMIYVDTNVVLDIVADGEAWHDWSAARLDEARATDRLVAGIVVVAEVAHRAQSQAALEDAFGKLEIEIFPETVESAFLAGQAFARYRKQGGQRASILPDFLIGGHAATIGATVLTRDPRRFRAYFPDLPLITPETES